MRLGVSGVSSLHAPALLLADHRCGAVQPTSNAFFLFFLVTTTPIFFTTIIMVFFLVDTQFERLQIAATRLTL